MIPSPARAWGQQHDSLEGASPQPYVDGVGSPAVHSRGFALVLRHWLCILQGINMPACFRCGLKPSNRHCSFWVFHADRSLMHDRNVDSLMPSSTRLVCFCCPRIDVLCHAAISAVIHADSVKNACAVLCCAVLCRAVLCCAVLCCAVL